MAVECKLEVQALTHNVEEWGEMYILVDPTAEADASDCFAGTVLFEEHVEYGVGHYATDWAKDQYTTKIIELND